MKYWVYFIIPIILLPSIAYGLQVGDSVPYIPLLETKYSINVKKPVFCIEEPDNKSIESKYNVTHLSQFGLKKWVDGLKQKTGGDWDFEIKNTSSTENNPRTHYNQKCNIKINFKTYNVKDTVVIGQTEMNYVKSLNKSFFNIVIFTSQVSKHGNQILIKSQSNETIKTVIQHELGHAFGLGHYYDGNDNLFNIDDSHKSIMYSFVAPKYDPNVLITNDDLNAIIQRYGTDGWLGSVDNSTKYYVIP